MPSFDSAWDDLTALSDLTISRWNDVKNDLKTWLDNAIDDTFMASAGILASRTDGVAATLNDPSAGSSEQTITRDTKINGSFHVDGEQKKTSVRVLLSALTTTPSVDGLNCIYVSQDSGTVAVTTLDDGELHQEVVFFGMSPTGSTGVISFVQQNTPGTDGFNLSGGVDFAPAPSANSVDMWAICFKRVDSTIVSEFTNGKWVEQWRRVV